MKPPIGSSIVQHPDATAYLRNLYDAALELRPYATNAAALFRRIGEPHIAVRLEAQLERLDAALADAQELMT